MTTKEKTAAGIIGAIILFATVASIIEATFKEAQDNEDYDDSQFQTT